jgi:hypothetical protein
MKSKLHWILYFVCLPWDLLVAWPVVLMIRWLWGTDLRWETPPYAKVRGCGPVLTCGIRAGTFPVTAGTFPKGWYLRKEKDGSVRSWGGTTLGHGIFYGSGILRNPGAWFSVQAHEHIHVEQFEASMFQSFVTGAISGTVVAALGHPLIGVMVFMAIWTLGYLFMAVAGWTAAALRGEEPYRGSHFEEHAYAEDDDMPGVSR